MQRTEFARLSAYALLPLLACGAAGGPALAQTDGGAVLTKAEAAYDCKKINGRMQILILQVRDYPDRDKGSLLARGLQGMTVPIFGGTRSGLDPDGQYARDLRKLQAFNARLVQLKCPTFDLEAELNSRDLHRTPKPQRTNK